MKAINKLAEILVSHNINGHEICHILMTYFGTNEDIARQAWRVAFLNSQ